ncbi:MAG: hypothetical protein L6R39_002379 [Caloplaca ligustica]|nr:MAG: hypothetical protein L6R39_002379 [Caloplaca ligustica]
MTLTIIHIPEEAVRTLQVVRAVQAAGKSLTVRIQKRQTRAFRIAYCSLGARRVSASGISMTSTTLAGVAPPQETSFPNPTYLRRRYKKLQRCRVSGEAGSQSPSLGVLDPSFQAIRALNGQPGTKPEPLVIHAIIKDGERGAAVQVQSTITTPTGQVPRTPQSLASSQHTSESFNARVDRLVHAVDKGQQIRFAPPNGEGRVEAFASAVLTSGASSGSWVTEESTAPLEALSQRARRRSGSPFPVLDAGYIATRHQISSSTDFSVTDYTSQRFSSPLISVDQRQQLLKHHEGQTERSTNVHHPAFPERVVRHERALRVDPRLLRTLGRDGVEHRMISPVPLNYYKPPNVATPSVSSNGSRSDLSSPQRYVPTWQATSIARPTYAIGSERPATALTGGNLWSPEATPSEEGSSTKVRAWLRKGKEIESGRQEKHSRPMRWLGQMKDAFSGKKRSALQESRTAIGVYRDKPSISSDKWATRPTGPPENVLRDLTNVRQPGYLERNSFAQEKATHEIARRRTKVPAKVTTQPSPRPVHPLAQTYVKAYGPQTELSHRSAGQSAAASTQTALRGHVANKSPPTVQPNCQESSRASTVKPVHPEELHPDVARALARLEGRGPPPSSTPIQRWRDDRDTYGGDVEVELGKLRLDAPQPVANVAFGEWTARFEDAVDAGFDSALEAPLSPETRRYIESI